VKPSIATADGPDMRTTDRGLAPLAASLAAALLSTALCVSTARADQSLQVGSAPLVVVRSAGGHVTVVRGDQGSVSVTGLSATATPFQLSQANQGRMVLPGGMGLPTRRFTLPPEVLNAPGVRVDNPAGGDITVSVPQRVAAILVRADTGDVSMTGIRGPYVIVASQGNVDASRLFGTGRIRTTAGHVNLSGIGGNVTVETTFGTVTGRGIYAERAQVTTQGGDIDWSVFKLGSGPYRFSSGAGAVRLGLFRGLAATIDAQSAQGLVTNRFGSAAAVRFRTQHAMSMMLGGGGPEITAASQSGKVDVGPPSFRKP
jgi:hypothetical protein